MKKLFCMAAVAMFLLTACADNSTEPKTETETTVEEKVDATQTEAEKRAQEIADSTKLLDKKLADPNDPMTPDSL